MAGRFAGKVVLVTGAATGIGRATAEYLVAEGASVFGIGLDGEAGRALDETYAASHLPLSFREVDLTDDAAVRTAVAACQREHGRLDAVVNCAGIYATGKRLEDVSDAEWDLTVAVNLTAIFRVCRAALPLIRASGGGSVVNLASVHAIATVPGVPAYAATKAAVVGLSKQMALDYAVDRIRVNAVLVGSVATRMTLGDAPDGREKVEAAGLYFDERKVPRVADPSELARAIGFLLSDDASFVTGSAFTADGGLTALLL
ncbi:SDR family NAD(P)-dependent oxidoreductase [Kaistia defluvii]|uniref:SDR family NAD(P)-dependent oxidoreductase n=1 Tax=Kaistia defluvii TaxID=410841 RepID=UPI002252666F|nr:SDR family NAD(P)-dependent oxidoreductase [Kaistia defluvii]MCX5519679.1 SDR family NAD(P)-dependent oxidoreductase [Kaistia defluvii]